jgi:hypothetical protein
MKVNFWYWLRAFIMVCALIVTIFIIRKLDRTSPSADPSATINLCPTRVTAIAQSEGTTVVQDGLAWFRKVNGGMEELDPIAVEKWFGRNCRVKADFAEGAPTSGAPVATVAFVSGPPQVLLVTGEGIYSWMGRAFRSTELQEALKDLKALPLRLRPSHH